MNDVFTISNKNTKYISIFYAVVYTNKRFILGEKQLTRVVGNQRVRGHF